jgi:putative membrane protein
MSMSSTLRDALLLFVHLLCIITLATLLVGELAVFRKSMPRDMVRRIQRIDRWYGIVAGLVIITGLLNVFFNSAGAMFFARNPVFWLKMALFLAVALLSIPPTIAYLRWNARAEPDGSIALDDAEFARIRGFLWVEVAIFVFIPLCATLMANGI